MDDILEVTRDYDRYKEFYRPSVIESRVVARGRFGRPVFNAADEQGVLLENGARCGLSRSPTCAWTTGAFTACRETTRVQEVEDYGQPSERRLPEGEGGGYIWKLFSIARLEQRDGGVYVEMETVALSREIPAMVRLVVDPIVRRVSRNSMLTSIQQTEEAVRCNSVAEMQRAESPLSGGHASNASAVLRDKATAFVQLR